MSHPELERRVGHKVGPKVVMYVLSDGVYCRRDDGSWERYEDER